MRVFRGRNGKAHKTFILNSSYVIRKLSWVIINQKHMLLFSFSFRFITGSEINTLLNVGRKTSNNVVYREKW